MRTTTVERRRPDHFVGVTKKVGKRSPSSVLLATKTRVIFLASVVDETDVAFEVNYTERPDDLEVTEVLEVHPSEGGVFRVCDGTLLRSIAYQWVGWLNEKIAAESEFRARVEAKLGESLS